MADRCCKSLINCPYRPKHSPSFSEVHVHKIQRYYYRSKRYKQKSLFIIYIYIGECVCVCVCVCVSFRRYTRLWSDRDQIWHTHADSYPNGSELNKNQLRVTQARGVWGGFRGSEIQTSGITTKRVDQLAPNLVHACGFIWEWT